MRAPEWQDRPGAEAPTNLAHSVKSNGRIVRAGAAAAEGQASLTLFLPRDYRKRANPSARDRVGAGQLLGGEGLGDAAIDRVDDLATLAVRRAGDRDHQGVGVGEALRGALLVAAFRSRVSWAFASLPAILASRFAVSQLAPRAIALLQLSNCFAANP
jgi:hypothetical protein